MPFRSAWPKVCAAAIIVGSTGLVPAGISIPAAAQTRPVLSNVVPADAAVTIHAKIKAIDTAKRHITLEERTGKPVTVLAAPDVRLEMLKVGDTVNAQYYRSVAFVISLPGSPVPEDAIKQAITRPVEAPGGVGLQVMRVSGLVVGIDRKGTALTSSAPRGARSTTST